ncbi:amino acid ABC transporter permease [Agrobacterium vitis]|uniref:ABC transporter permease subunit n=1 Tax=Agrobacterium vitis TaxID=373 RepID=A0AAE5AWQ2_AGRVI|nr:amino acid ABC transporter permease [Agrobacterium vitis]MCF1499931.1 amino acid ABC transporter permease [Allorhizobium sp. Av2]MCM2442856.1 amino acid ABC transporter permease [Agrobacterium vitis]MUZ58794.1 ABC transporter permease subunit [Agrobacterium vitis]MVA66429.1 ABC transporter permease subunit [Agrobacterium vitis]MVA88466.1 ABC transporter permease subunit [Agrobacterium vitis]
MKGFDLSAILGNPDYVSMLLHGIEMTFIIAIGSWMLAMTLAVLLLALRFSPGGIGNGIVTAYVSYHRNVPTLVQLVLWYFGIFTLMPSGLSAWLVNHNAEAIFAVIGLGLCQAAYFSEDLRSGLRSISPGQMEAARALGHGYISAMRYVMIPQGVRNALPPLINHTVSLFKNSSLAIVVGASELTHAVKEIENITFRTFESYLIGTVLYLFFSLLIMAGGAYLSWRVDHARGVRS